MSRSVLTNKLTEKFNQDKVKGLALQVMMNNEATYDNFYGSYNEEDATPTENTLFGVASLTKSVTAVGIMKLQDDNKLSVKDLVSDWLPELELSESVKNVMQIHHLLTHTAGFPGMNAFNLARLESLKQDPDATHLFGELPKSERTVVTVKDMIEAMNESSYNMIAKPGELFNYSNEGYALLEEIIKRASKKTYINFINENIFMPLEMNHSVFTFEELQNFEEVTELYAFTKDKARERFFSPTWWASGEIYGAGALKSTTNDLLKYLEIFKNDGYANGVKILSKGAVEAMTTAHIETPNKNKYGYGLMVGEFAGKKVIGHGGGVKGVSSYMLICKELDYTSVALTNSAELPAEDYLVTAFSEITNTNVDIPVSRSNERKDVSKYVGVYRSNEGTEIVVNEVEDFQLKLTIGHLTFNIDHERDSLFILPNGKRLAFVMLNNEVTGIFRGMRYIEKVDRSD